MGYKATVPVDGQRLQAAVIAHELKARQVALECGFNPDYISNSAYKGKISRVMQLLLEKRYGIPYSEYAPVEAKQETQQEQETQTAQTEQEAQTETDNKPEPAVQGLDWDRLYQCVYTATYHAVKHAWENE